MHHIKFKDHGNRIINCFVHNSAKAYFFVRAFIEALPEAFKRNLLQKNIYKQSIAYGLIIAMMKHGDDQNENNDCWKGELPSIYDLDSITYEMNENINDLNDTLKMKKKIWKREEVKKLMDSFERVYNRYCCKYEKQLSISFVVSRINLLLEESFLSCFKGWYSMKLQEIAENYCKTANC